MLRLITHVPLSGPLASYADVARGSRAYFESINDSGGVFDAKIQLDIIDSEDDPAATLRAMKAALREGDVFGVFHPIGDPAQKGILDLLEETRTPTFFMGSGLGIYTNPFRRIVFVSNPTYRALGLKLARHWRPPPGPVRTIGLVYLDRASGREFAEGVRSVFAGTGTPLLERVVSLTATMGPVVEELRASGADAVFLFLLSQAVLEFADAARDHGYRPTMYSAFMDLLVEKGGAAVDGIISSHWLMLVGDDTDPTIQRHVAMLSRYEPGARPSSLTIGGQAAAELMVESLRRAGPGAGPDQVVRAAESIRRWQCSVCLMPVEMGAHDHLPYEDLVLFRAVHGSWQRIR